MWRVNMDSILDWEEKVAELRRSKSEVYDILNQIYLHYSAEGTMIIPETFKDKALTYMGDKSLPSSEALERIENQRILKIYNKWTGEGTVFNSLRAQRPGVVIENKSKKLENLIKETEKNCDFCNPEKYTPEDPFGRIKGEHSITASNLAKYDVWSSLLIFRKHNPLDFNQGEISDYIDTAFNWFNRVYQYDSSYQFPFLVWNCLYKSGASQVHGHAQLLVTRDFPYAKIGNLYKAAHNYKDTYNKDYFKDLYYLHQALGLANSKGNVKILVNISPIKEKEILIISPDRPSSSPDAKEVVYQVLRCYIDVLGVESFNLAIQCPPINYENFPYIIKIVDRGKLFTKTADMGGMELYGSSVASEDPYMVMKALREYWGNL
jgi:hypothetical protein